MTDFTGQTFGVLRVLGPAPAERPQQRYWRCRCSCDHERNLSTYRLKQAKNKPCRCVSYHKPLGPPPRCACGCGSAVTRKLKMRRYNKFIHGHHLRKYKTDRMRRKAQVLRVYNLTPQDYDVMLESQGGRCKICGSAEPGKGRQQFCVDHDHTTGAVRGLLCAHCNLGIGYLKDDPDLCAKAALYLGAQQPTAVRSGHRRSG